ncbi:hypothetical protein [Calothrix parietina]|nr:hypothetical protein [Calothrix parietina]
MSLPYFKEFGWKPHILTVRPEFIEGVNDSLLAKTIPQHIPVTYTKALPFQYTKHLGIGSLGLRCFPYLLQAGDRLLSQTKFDLIYFSTTVFITMALGARWYRRFNIPYVLDFQDPWLSDYYEKSGLSPPGGRLKYKFSQLQAEILEPIAVSNVNHIISVSPEYPKTLQQRYKHLKAEQFTVLPFGAPESDFEQLPSLNIQQQIFNPKDGKRHWVYVGAVGNIMSFALRVLFLGIQSQRRQNPEVWESIKLHFVGTSYASDHRAVKTVEPIAKELGVADLVEEYPYRIPYFEALQTLIDSDAILLIGSDDPGYTASKLYPCILAKKPILAIFHQQSSVIKILNKCRAGRAITFTSGNQPGDLLNQITAELNWFLSLQKGYQPETDWSAFKAYTAKEMTRQQCCIFDLSLN